MSRPRPKMFAADVNAERLELRRLQERVERLFQALEEALESETADSFDSFTPAVDLCENERAVEVEVELPGVESDQVRLTVTAKDILIEGRKENPAHPNGAVSHFCCERRYGKFRRRIQLRWAININETTAELKDGILRIFLPKLVDRRGKSVRVPITSEE